MKLKIFTKGKVGNLDIFTYLLRDITTEIQKTLELKDIITTRLIIPLVMTENSDLKRLTNEIEDYSLLSDIKMKIENITKMGFELILDGKLGDILGAILTLDINKRFKRLDIYIREDINMIKDLLGKHSNRFDTGRSLIIKYLSINNGNLSFNDVYRVLQREYKKTELRKFLPDIFKEVYGFSMEEAKYSATVNKLDLESIDDTELKSMEDDYAIRIRDVEYEEVAPRVQIGGLR